MIRISTVVCIALLGMSLSACNVFEGMAGEDTLSDNVAVLLSDGQRALDAGRSDEAVRILTRAVELTMPARYEGRIARIKLASAKLQARRISVLELQEVTAGLVDRLDTLPATPRDGLQAGPVCSFEPPDTAYEGIDLGAVEGYARLRSNKATLEEVRELIREALGVSVIASRTQLQAGLRSLSAEGADDAILAEALANGAVASAGVAYDAIIGVGAAAEVAWVKVKSPTSPDVYLGFCASSQAAVNGLRTQARSQVDLFTSAVEMVDLRAGLALFAGDSASQALVRETRAALERLQKSLGADNP